MSKVIITCAVTGSIHTPTMSPHLPITPDEIAADGVAAAEAGASILHLYARDPADGRPPVLQPQSTTTSAGYRPPPAGGRCSPTAD